MQSIKVMFVLHYHSNCIQEMRDLYIYFFFFGVGSPVSPTQKTFWIGHAKLAVEVCVCPNTLYAGLRQKEHLAKNLCPIPCVCVDNSD